MVGLLYCSKKLERDTCTEGSKIYLELLLWIFIYRYIILILILVVKLCYVLYCKTILILKLNVDALITITFYAGKISTCMFMDLQLLISISKWNLQSKVTLFHVVYWNCTEMSRWH